MTRYKRYGQMLVVEPPPKAVEEISVRELSRDTSARPGSRGGGETRRGHQSWHARGGILEVEEAVGLCASVLIQRQEAERRLFGAELCEQLRERRTRRALRMLDSPRKAR